MRSSLQDWVYLDDEPPPPRSERVAYALVTALVVLSMALAVFA